MDDTVMENNKSKPKNGKIVDDVSIKYYLNDRFHREDGPAIEYLSGTKYWCINGEMHRDGNLPAVEFSNGDKFYYIHGKAHREDGPASEYVNGTKFYYLDGIEFSEQNYWKEIKRRKSLNYILSNMKKKFGINYEQ